MTWLAIIALAGIAFALSVLVLRLPRASWTLMGAALLFGLAGYAAQGSPDRPGAPAEARKAVSSNGELLVAARREFFGADRLPSRYVVTSDAFARRGNWRDAANFLRNALAENPQDGEAWLALGNALVEMAEGRSTPAADYAFARARETAKGNLAPDFFAGLTLLRSGDPIGARTRWAEALANAAPKAAGRDVLADRLERLDALIDAMRAQAGQMQAPETTR